MRLVLCLLVLFLALVPSARAAHLSGYWMMVFGWNTYSPVPLRHLRGPFASMGECQVYLQQYLRSFPGSRIMENQCKFTDQVGW